MHIKIKGTYGLKKKAKYTLEYTQWRTIYKILHSKTCGKQLKWHLEGNL